MKLYLTLDASTLDIDLKKLKVNLDRAKNIDHKWIPSHQWHIPLCPLGEVNPEIMSELHEKINHVLSKHSSFDLKLDGVWAYPSQDRGRLLWIGVQNLKELRSLQEEIFEELKDHIPVETLKNSFRPYLPIVRFRNYKEVSDLLSPHKNAHFGKIKINKLILYEMTSPGSFPTYRKVNEFILRDEELEYENQIGH